MPINFDGIWEIRVNSNAVFGTQTIPHVMTFDVNLAASPDPGTPFVDIPTLNHDSSESNLTLLISDLMSHILTLFPDEVTFTTAELWKYPVDGYDAVFYGIHSIAADGLNSGPMSVAHYDILTWRSLAGGIMKLYLLETASTANGIVSYPTGNTTYDDLFEFISSVEQPFVARDNSRPLAPLKVSSGQNEALWRRRYRS